MKIAERASSIPPCPRPANTFDRVELGITARNKRGTYVSLPLKDVRVGSCCSGCALLLEGTQAHGGLGADSEEQN